MNKELEVLEEIEKNIKFFNEKYNEIREKYRGKWIVIKNREIKLVGNNLDEIYEIIEKKKIDIDGALIEYIPEKEEVWIL